MDKIAIIELNTTSLKLVFSYVIKNRSFLIYNEIVTPVNLTKDFDSDEIIKPTVIGEIKSALLVFKKMMETEEVSENIAVACDFIKNAKNQNGFLNELYSTTGFNFKVLSPLDELNYIYASAINTFNKPKALILQISDYYTQIMLYNRRNILNTEVVPFGTLNLPKAAGVEGLGVVEAAEKMTQFFEQQLSGFSFMQHLDEEFEIIGFGKTFLALGNLARRAKKYPLDIEHNYVVSKEDFDKVYEVIKPLDQTKTTKIKGVSLEDSKNIPAGFAMLSALFKSMNKGVVAISKTDKVEGILLNTVIPYTLEKPISDNLGYSLQVLNEYYDHKPNNSEHIYNLSMILFKQLKVLHKLNRSFVKVLRVASYMSACGKRVDYYNAVKASFHCIVNSNIYGISHSELVLSAFVALLRDQDNFNMAEWVKFKDLVSETDLDAVKKLAVILKIAENLDITSFGNILDISCDILGDSVIMKTITKADASLEIKQAMQMANEFKKAFNKNLEIL